MRLKDLKRQMEFLDIQAQIGRVGNEKGSGCLKWSDPI